MNADVRDLYLAYLVACYTLARSADYGIERYADDDEGRWITIGGRPEGDKKHVGGTHVKVDSQGRIIDGPEELEGQRVSDLSKDEPGKPGSLDDPFADERVAHVTEDSPRKLGPLAQEKIYELGYSHTIYRGLRRRPIHVKNIFGEYEKKPTLDMKEVGYAFFTDDIAYAERFADPQDPEYIQATIEPRATILDLANGPDFISGEYLDSIIPGLAEAMGYSYLDEEIEAEAIWSKPDENIKPLADFVRRYGIDVIMWREQNSWTFIVVNPDMIDIEGVKKFYPDEDEEEDDDEDEQ